jgi:hypothetical protein
MIFTATHHGQTVTIDDDRDDLTIEEAVRMLRHLLLAMGYHPDNVNEYFPE